MAIQLGNGLPSTLTAERIKAVLALAKSHERILEETLNAKASPPWIATDPDGDLYDRLCAIIATVEGRKAYDQARFEFENSKAKRLGRADLPRRLMEDCLKETASQPGTTGHGSDFEQDPIQRLVEASAWAQVAEAVWAESLIASDTEHLLDALTRFPDIIPYLEEVQAGLIQDEYDETRPVPEEEGEASELVDRIRRVAELLDADRLNERELPGLSLDARRLTEIAKARTLRIRDLSLLRAQVESWEERHEEGISAAEAATKALAALKTQIELGTAEQNTVTAVLDLAERLLTVEDLCRETQDKLNQASIDADFVKARSLLDALESLHAERDDSLLAINALVAEPRSEPLPLQIPDAEHTAAPPEPKTKGSETDPAEPGSPAAGPALGTVDRTEANQEPDTDQASSPDDNGKDDEPATPQDGPAPIEESACNEDAARTAEQPDDYENKASQHTEYTIKTAMERGRLGIAYHLALAIPDASPNANTVKLVACNYVTDNRVPIGTELSDLAGALLNEAKTADVDEANQPRQRDEAVLTTCAALAPALEAPGGLVAQLLSALEAHLGDMPSLRALAKAAAEVSMTGVHLPISLLREDDTIDKWRDRELALRTETTSLARKRAPIDNQIIKRQTRVWRRMLEDWGARWSVFTWAYICLVG